MNALIAGLLAVALGAGVVWGAHYERDIGRAEVRAEWERADAAAVLAANKIESALRARVVAAENKGNERDQTNRNLAAAAAGASIGLRDTLATIRASVPGDTVETLRARTVTLAGVLGECQGRYQELARHADGHASDVQTLIDAWPTSAPPAAP